MSEDNKVPSEGVSEDALPDDPTWQDLDHDPGKTAEYVDIDPDDPEVLAARRAAGDPSAPAEEVSS